MRPRLDQYRSLVIVRAEGEGLLTVDRVTAEVASRFPDLTPPTLVVAECAIALPDGAPCLAYADAPAQMAVISIAHLDTDGAARLPTRIAGLMAHELGHLNGLAHCASGQCVMHAVADPRQLDDRPLDACGRCPTLVITPPASRIAAAAALLLLIVFGLARVAGPIFTEGP